MASLQKSNSGKRPGQTYLQRGEEKCNSGKRTVRDNSWQCTGRFEIPGWESAV